MRDTLRPKYWKYGSDIIVLAEVTALVMYTAPVPYPLYKIKVHMRHGGPIEMSWSKEETRDNVAQSLSQALELFLLDPG